MVWKCTKQLLHLEPGTLHFVWHLPTSYIFLASVFCFHLEENCLAPFNILLCFQQGFLVFHMKLPVSFFGKRPPVLFDDVFQPCRYSGPTVHFVDEQFDTGKTLAQRVVPVLANDTSEQLAARVLHEVASYVHMRFPFSCTLYYYGYLRFLSFQSTIDFRYSFCWFINPTLQEHQVYVEAVAALCEDRIVWRDDGVPLIRSQTNPNAYT